MGGERHTTATHLPSGASEDPGRLLPPAAMASRTPMTPCSETSTASPHSSPDAGFLLTGSASARRRAPTHGGYFEGASPTLSSTPHRSGHQPSRRASCHLCSHSLSPRTFGKTSEPRTAALLDRPLTAEALVQLQVENAGLRKRLERLAIEHEVSEKRSREKDEVRASLPAWRSLARASG